MIDFKFSTRIFIRLPAYVLDILNVYTLEIQKCLMDNERVPTRCEYMMEHIIDEIDYWKNRRKFNKKKKIIWNENLLRYEESRPFLRVLY